MLAEQVLGLGEGLVRAFDPTAAAVAATAWLRDAADFVAGAGWRHP